MKVLFSHSYFMPFDPKQWGLGQPYPPLGTIWAAAVLREAGCEVALFDSQFTDQPEDVVPFFEKQRPELFIIYDDGFNYLTKMCLTNMREAAFRMQEIAKRYGCKVAVSSSDSSDHYEQYLDRGADFVFLGEAEITLRELTIALREGRTDFETIEGLAFRRDGKTIANARRKVIGDLDALPLPAWDLIDIGNYRRRWQESSGYFSINMGTTRGCPFKCNWCAKPIYGNRYHSRSPENVIEEIKLLKKNYGFDHIWFSDDIFGLKPGWVQRFADLAEKEQLQLRYKIQSRADLLLQENTIEALARSGCETVWMGAESGSQRILDAMDKGTTIDQIREATRLLKKHKIRPAFFLQFGYPGETIEDIHKTIDLLNELLPEDIGVSVSYPLPGTKFYENVKAELKEKANWTDSDELALMFRNTYSPAFYKQLHRYVHKNYRKHQGFDSLKRLLRKPFSLDRAQLRRAAAVPYYIPAVLMERRRLQSIEHAWR